MAHQEVTVSYLDDAGLLMDISSRQKERGCCLGGWGSGSGCIAVIVTGSQILETQSRFKVGVK